MLGVSAESRRTVDRTASDLGSNAVSIERKFESAIVTLANDLVTFANDLLRDANDLVSDANDRPADPPIAGTRYPGTAEIVEIWEMVKK
jgi:hypothetical protein